MTKRSITALTLLLVIFVCHAPAIAKSKLRIPDQITGELAYEHLFYLSEVIGARVAGTPEEGATADYIAQQFADLGYHVKIQPFTAVNNDGITYSSANVIATRKGCLNQTVIVGAHYDSVAEKVCEESAEISTGAGDNASGVAVMLEVAAALASHKTKGTLKFIAFGAEEAGLLGSTHYAKQMSEEDAKHTVAMINIDSVGAGDFFYVYSGLEDNPGWARNTALNIGKRMGYDLRTSPASEYYEYGTTGDWSDHVAFRHLGIPIAYFEWMNWDIEPDGGIETEEFGWIMHTCMDNLSHSSIEKLEMTGDVIGVLAFKLSNVRYPQLPARHIVKFKENGAIRIQERNRLPH